MLRTEKKAYKKKLKRLDKQIKKKCRKFTSQIKEIFNAHANIRSLRNMRGSKQGGIWLNVIYYDDANRAVHSYHQECDNIIEAIHTLYSFCEPLFINAKDDFCNFFYELFDNITDKANLLKTTTVEFSLEIRRDYKIKN